MSATLAREVVLAKRPTGPVLGECFEVVDVQIPSPAPGEVLFRSAYFSVDPSMIPRLTRDTYAPKFSVGESVEARAVGRVITSTDPAWAEGDWGLYYGGWREFASIPAVEAMRFTPSDAVPPDTWLHALGAPGLTAYIGLVDIARVQPGDRVWVSAAAGAVGSFAAQLAKARGASWVIGSAGGAAKTRYLLDTVGVDAAIDYRSGDLVQQLKEASPDGIDVYFDNVGGDHLDAAIKALRIGGRVAMCGVMSIYGDNSTGVMHNTSALIVKRLKVEGFLVLDHADRNKEFEAEVAPLVASGAIRVDTTMFDGIESASEALMSLLSGDKIGKAMVKL
jgi:NADPH-dependent curcumin reductase CurA